MDVGLEPTTLDFEPCGFFYCNRRSTCYHCNSPPVSSTIASPETIVNGMHFGFRRSYLKLYSCYTSAIELQFTNSLLPFHVTHKRTEFSTTLNLVPPHTAAYFHKGSFHDQTNPSSFRQPPISPTPPEIVDKDGQGGSRQIRSDHWSEPRSRTCCTSSSSSLTSWRISALEARPSLALRSSHGRRWTLTFELSLLPRI